MIPFPYRAARYQLFADLPFVCVSFHRRYKLHPQKQRSKYICKPEAVVEAGNHFVWEFSPGKVSLNVPPKEAILQHYRVCEFGGNDCIKAPSVVDRTTSKYVNRLVQRVDAVYRHLRQRCDLPALPTLPNPEPKEADAPLEIQPKENPKLLHHIRQLNAQDTRETRVSATTKTAPTRATTTTTTTTTTRTTTTTTTTTTKRSEERKEKPNPKPVPVPSSTTGTTAPPKQPSPQSSNVRKKRKLIVFEVNDFGVPVARVEYQ
ncbi:salivary glue protein Sgs-3-like [Drosophila subobscura]|uniref:salivary glue protein Sgs-3-like n=1 Tax=Drosophila subobscura TaxID=7241 RepID=UPI00155AF12D|nr:salivary glue protein Sgs-3-like [Drosophila subobscura]